MAITITLNGKKKDVEEGMSISKLLQAMNVRPEVVTVELNDKIVDRGRYADLLLHGGDRVEFVYYMGGGSYACNRIAESVVELIGSTPLLRLSRLAPAPAAHLVAKVEFFNPGGSVKDRICLSMIEDAEKKGFLKPGSTIIEPTSGNTGIGLAMIAAIKGYRCVLVMPETMSLERIYILKTFGAEVVLTSGIDGMQGAIKKAEELLEEAPGSFMPQQFKNPANPQIHRQTTAQEILEATQGRLDVFVAGVGTGGTITGVGEVLKKHNSKIKVVAVEPSGSAVLSGQPYGPHKIQGIGAGFIPEILNRTVIDQVIAVSDNDAFRMTRRLAKEEGLFVGISSGAACWAALEVARGLGKEKTVVVILPDTGERYFSMLPYFEDSSREGPVSTTRSTVARV